jgi:hypothetical protein
MSITTANKNMWFLSSYYEFRGLWRDTYDDIEELTKSRELIHPERTRSVILNIPVRKNVYNHHPTNLILVDMVFNVVPDDVNRIFVKVTLVDPRESGFIKFKFYLDRPRSSSMRHLLSILRKEVLKEWENQ